MIDYVGRLGPRWGLPADPCRVHALLYTANQPRSVAEIARLLGLSQAQAVEAIAYLEDYGLAFGDTQERWRTQSDPWEMLLTGLERRRQMELPEALAVFRQCRREADADPELRASEKEQFHKILRVVEGIAAIDAQMKKISPRALKRFVQVSSQAASWFEAARGGRTRR